MNDKIWMENVPKNMNKIKEFLICMDTFNSKVNVMDNSFQFDINEKNFENIKRKNERIKIKSII